MTKQRTFDFDPTVSRAEALRVIVAALADEGLRINDNDNARLSQISTYIVTEVGQPRKRVVVPAHRISPIKELS